MRLPREPCAEHVFGEITSYTRSIPRGLETKVLGAQSEGLPAENSSGTRYSDAIGPGKYGFSLDDSREGPARVRTSLIKVG
jgi:hypothetical protein